VKRLNKAIGELRRAPRTPLLPTRVDLAKKAMKKYGDGLEDFFRKQHACLKDIREVLAV